MHAGSTDQLILLHVLVNRGFDKDEVVAKMPALKKAMVEYAEANSASAAEGLVLLPGVEATLKALKARGDVRVGLVTGNLEPIAWMKMRALGIHDYFSQPNFGGFGSDYSSFNPEHRAEDRAELVKIAGVKAQGLFDGFEGAARYHIGDAPADVIVCYSLPIYQLIEGLSCVIHSLTHSLTRFDYFSSCVAVPAGSRERGRDRGWGDDWKLWTSRTEPPHKK